MSCPSETHTIRNEKYDLIQHYQMSHYALINSVFDNVTLGIIQFYLHSPHQLPIGGSTGLATSIILIHMTLN